MKHKLRWKNDSRTAYLDSNYLSPKKSQAVFNHSPDGFNVGYGGSGCSQLALAILLELTDRESALVKYQQFKWTYIATMQKDKDCEIEFEF